MMQLSKEREITIIVFLMGDYSFAYTTLWKQLTLMQINCLLYLINNTNKLL